MPEQSALFDLQEMASTPALMLDRAAVEAVKMAGAVAIDSETETAPPPDHPLADGFGLSYCTSPTLVSFAWRGTGEGVDGQGTRVLVMDGAWPETGELLKYLYRNTPMLVFHNAVFDIRILSKITGGAWPENGVWDTQVMAQLFKPDLTRPSLLSVADAWGCAYPAWMREMKDKRGALHRVPAAEVVEYAGWDARLTFAVYKVQEVALEDTKTFELADWECRAVREYGRMAAEGVRVYVGALTAKVSEWQAAHEATRKALIKDGLFNPDSSAQVVKYIYETKGVPRPEFVQGSKLFTKTGNLSGSGDAILELLEQAPEHAERLKLLADYAQLDSQLAAARALKDHAMSEGGDGRIHSMVSIVTHTGRRASSQPNIQNLTMRPDVPRNMCGVLTGSNKDFTLFELDYSNAENWIAAMIAGDDALAAACAAADFHSEMAKIYWPDRWGAAEAAGDKAALKALRSEGKGITFGTAYGMGPKSLAVNLKMSEAEARAMLAKKDRAFSRVAAAKKAASQKAETKGFVTLWTGRNVALGREGSFRAWNYVCQGGVGELIKRALVLISEAFRERGMKSRVAHDMHDALILDVYHPEWDEALRIASDIMTHVMPRGMNERTEPSIRWIADVDEKAQKENAAKWGKYQWHPAPKVAPAPEPKPEPIKQEVKEVSEPKKQRTVQVMWPVMGGWRNPLVQEQHPDGKWRASDAEGRAHVQRLHDQCAWWLGVKEPTTLPNGQMVTVDRLNSLKVTAMWVKFAQESGDTDQLTDWTLLFEAHKTGYETILAAYQWAKDVLEGRVKVGAGEMQGEPA